MVCNGWLVGMILYGVFGTLAVILAVIVGLILRGSLGNKGSTILISVVVSLYIVGLIGFGVNLAICKPKYDKESCIHEKVVNQRVFDSKSLRRACELMGKEGFKMEDQDTLAFQTAEAKAYRTAFIIEGMKDGTKTDIKNPNGDVLTRSEAIKLPLDSFACLYRTQKLKEKDDKCLARLAQ